MIALRAKSTRIKSSLLKVREEPDVKEKALIKQRTLIRLLFFNQNNFRQNQPVQAEVGEEHQKATIERIGTEAYFASFIPEPYDTSFTRQL